MTVALRVDVLLFARLRELAGCRSVTVELASPARAIDAWTAAVVAHPRLREAEIGARVAVNERYADWGQQLGHGDVVAVIPPVAGGAADVDGQPPPAGAASRTFADIRDTPLDARRVEALVRTDRDGAVCTFTGTVRDHAEGRAVTHIDYEAYRSMAVNEMSRIAEEAVARSGATAVAVEHRVGRLGVGEASVVVSASAPHRAAAFEACRHAIDAVKAQVPIWKREHGSDGPVWVDEAARPH